MNTGFFAMCQTRSVGLLLVLQLCIAIRAVGSETNRFFQAHDLKRPPRADAVEQEHVSM